MIRTPRNPRVAPPHRPKDAPSPPGSWIIETGGGGTGGGGSGGTGGPAPPVSIVGSADVIFRSDHRVEVAVDWTPNATATAANFRGVAIYLEDPDISSGANHPLNGLDMPLDGTAQVSGEWAPVFVNESVKSPAIIFLDSTMGSTFGQTYKDGRDIRIYLAAYGPYSHPHPVRATDTTETPSPNLMVYIPKGRSQGESGQEWAFLITDPKVSVNPDYNRLTPKYNLTLTYTPPDPSIPVPPGINHFGGCRIVFVYENDSGDPIFPGSDTGMTIPVAQANTGFKSDDYEPNPAGGKFRVYFCSEDDSQPLGHHVNSLVEGTTPFAYANIPAVDPTPDVTNFSISGQETRWFADGSSVAHADFSWHLPDISNNIRYAGVYLYLVKAVVKATGVVSTINTVPKDLSGPQSNVATNYPKDVPDVPSTPEIWTIAAISYDTHGGLKYNPKTFGTPGFAAPIVQWEIGPPAPGTAGSGQEYAPFVTLGPGASASAAQNVSSDGVGMVSFSLGPWVNPDDNKFGNAQVAMVVDHDTNRPTLWTVPANATSFITPSMPSFGNIGSQVDVDFYLLSDDPQGNKNHLVSSTPKIPFKYTPAAGAIIPSRAGWFDDSQFSWVGAAGGLHADHITADNVYIEKVLVVGGAPNPTFQGMSNGQIAVKNSSQVLRAWIGEQQPTQGDGSQLWGGWFGQLWVGGTNPLDSPLFVDNQGIIQVGGLAAVKGSRYPYISVRDQSGVEAGRIGASLSSANDPSGNVGSNPPSALTAGAWFSQLAVGGNNLTNWNVLITPDNTKPLGSLFQIRNIHLLSIDYAAQKLLAPYNEQYKLEFGNSAWATTGGGSWQFPGIHLYEVDPQGGTGFGAVYLNRGMVLKGTHDQGYPVLVSLVTYNGAPSGIDTPAQFWGELAMYSPLANYARTVYLSSGGQGTGNAQFGLADVNGNSTFQVNINGDTFIKGVLQGTVIGGAAQPVTALAYNVQGRAVIDSTGHWVGQAITTSGGQTPWATPINGNNQPLNNAGSVQAAQFVLNSGNLVVIDSGGTFRGVGVDVGSGRAVYCSVLATNQYAGQNAVYTGDMNGTGTVRAAQYVVNSYGPAVIDTAGTFRGNGVDVGSGKAVYCSVLATNQYAGQNAVFTGTLSATGSVTANGGYFGGAFQGAGVNVGNQGIGCGSISVTGPDGASSACSVNGTVNCVQLKIGGTLRIDTNGIYKGGLQFPDNVYGQEFGIFGYSKGWYGSFYDRDNGFHVVRGGLLINNPPSAREGETAVVCDRCGSWQITFRRKTPLPSRQLKLSEAVAEMSAPKAEPGALQEVEMIAECDECHFTVEYSSLVN